MIDLNKEISKLIEENFDTIIIRHKTDTKCNCWREESNTPDPRCGRCQGLGWIFEEFLHKGKFFLLDSQRVAHTQDYSYGKSYSNAFTLYLPVSEGALKIRIDDYIFTIATAINGKIIKPIRRIKKWIVTDYIPQHMEKGRLEFVQVLAKPVDV